MVLCWMLVVLRDRARCYANVCGAMCTYVDGGGGAM